MYEIFQLAISRNTNCHFRIFGQLLLLSALDMSKDSRLTRLLPADYFQKRLELITFMSEVAPDSPSISEDVVLLLEIYR
jgi:hypothetical protein